MLRGTGRCMGMGTAGAAIGAGSVCAGSGSGVSQLRMPSSHAQTSAITSQSQKWLGRWWGFSQISFSGLNTSAHISLA